MVWPFVYRAGDRLSSPELMAARLDGDLVELGEAFIPADAVETAPLRAASLVPIVGDDLALTHESAAWVHGALPWPPLVHRVQRTSRRRLRRLPGARVRYRDVTLPDADITRLGTVLVTTPERTVIDLVREAIELSHPPGSGAWLPADALLADDPGLATAAIARLDELAGLHHKRPALDHLRAVQATASAAQSRQDDVTRYTS